MLSGISNHVVIGIGFSAGGFEPLIDFFNNTPLDNASYVIIQHLPLNYKSQMVPILAKHSILKVMEMEDGLDLKPNHVYLMPERKSVEIKNGRLALSDHEEQPNDAIDRFFDSLALDKGNKSIAVILSGSGTDGTRGAESIKKAGGVVVVQTPASSRYDSMPNSIIEAGIASMVLSAEEMPLEIANYTKHSLLINQLSVSDEQNLVTILNLIKHDTPFDFTDYKRPTLVRRILRRMTSNNVRNLSEYAVFLNNNHGELQLLSTEFLINVTKFFRDKEAFDIIRDRVIPEILKEKLSVDLVKIWCIGCATGEEAYSLAIIIKEYLDSVNRKIEIKIFATDIDRDAIAIASKGIYSSTIEADVSLERLAKFFVKEDNQYKVAEEIRKMVVFASHDIIRQPPYGKIDLISCRNLLIYLDPVLQKKIFSTLHFCMNMGGFLMLGPSESIGELRSAMLETDAKWKIYKNIQYSRKIGSVSYTAPGIDIKQISTLPTIKHTKNTININLTDSIILALTKHTGSAGVSIDENFKIIQPFGDFKRFLLPEMFNLNLLELVPREIAIVLGTSLREAITENKQVEIEGIRFIETKLRSVDITIIPFLSESKNITNSIVVIFNEKPNSPVNNVIVKPFDINERTSRYIMELEREIKELKGKLNETFIELEVSQDNAQSYNEELISSYEEMQSTNEELQSVNEELQTVNNEYQAKMKELAELNDDLNNYFRSSSIGQIFVDTNLIIRKFTPMATKQINLIETDLGRSLSNISTNIKFEGMIEDIVRVISDSVVCEKDVESKEGKWYKMTIAPYVSMEAKNNGAIITFSDVSDLKKAQDIINQINEAQLVAKNEELKRINIDLDNFVYTASHDLKAPVSNLEGLLNVVKEFNEEDGEFKYTTEMMEVSIGHLKKTIEELTQIAKAQKSVEEDVDFINLSELLQDVKFSIKELILKEKAIIHEDFDKGTRIKFSRKNLRSILYNLLSNAIKYRSLERRPEVFITASISEKFIQISISDNGLGIDDKNRDKLFTIYKRFHNHVEGTGIGLYIVKRIIENAGGNIQVTSDMKKGTTFNVFLKNESNLSVKK